MTVSLNVSANVTGVKSALDQMVQGIKRAGQEGKAFADMNLGHPELKGMADDMAKLQRAYENMLRVARGATADSARAGGYSSVFDWHANHGTQFTNQTSAQRNQSNGLAYISNPSNQYQYTQPQSGGGSGGSSSGTGGSSGGGSGGSRDSEPSAWGRFKQGSAFAAGLAGIPMIGGLLSRAVGGAQDDLIATDTFKRSLIDSGTDFDKLRTAIHKSVEGFALTYSEAQHLTATWQKLGANLDSSSILDNVRISSGIARGLGADPGQYTQSQARASFAGSSAKEFSESIVSVLRTSGMIGRPDEAAQAIAHWAEVSVRQKMTGNTSADFAVMYAAMNPISGNKRTGNPGLWGDAGVDILSNVNSTISQGGGGGEAGKALMYKIMAKNGVDSVYKQEEMLLANGVFTKFDNGKYLIDEIRNTTRSQYGITDKTDKKSEQYSRYLSGFGIFTGMTPSQSRAWNDLPSMERSRISGLSEKDRANAMFDVFEGYKDGSRGAQAAKSKAEVDKAIVDLGDNIVPLTDAIKHLLIDGLNHLNENIGFVLKLIGKDNQLGNGTNSLSKYVFGNGLSSDIVTSLGGDPQKYRNEHPETALPNIGPVDTSNGIESAIVSAAKEAGVDPGLALTMASIESKMGKSPDKPGSQYKGVFQLGKKEREDLGVTDLNQYDLATQIRIGVLQLKKDKDAISRRLGRDVTNEEVDLAHNQGTEGAAKLINNPDWLAVNAIAGAGVSNPDPNITGNGGNTTMTSAEFIAMRRKNYAYNAGLVGQKVAADDPVMTGAGSGKLSVGGALAVHHYSDGQHIGSEEVPLVPGEPEPFGGGHIGIGRAFGEGQYESLR